MKFQLWVQSLSLIHVNATSGFMYVSRCTHQVLSDLHQQACVWSPGCPLQRYVHQAHSSCFVCRPAPDSPHHQKLWRSGFCHHHDHTSVCLGFSIVHHLCSSSISWPMVSPSRLRDASDPETFSRCITVAVYVNCTICHSYRKGYRSFKCALAYGIITRLLHRTDKQAVTGHTDQKCHWQAGDSNSVWEPVLQNIHQGIRQAEFFEGCSGGQLTADEATGVHCIQTHGS